LLIQVITFWLMPAHPLSLISGMLGICSVVLSAQGNILTFLFGFAQVGTYTYLCCLERFYAEIALNVFYFLSMIYGVFVWHRRLNDQSLQVQTRVISPRWMLLISMTLLLLSLLTGWLLHRFTDDPQPYLDAFTTVPAILAQILMVLAFREQWYLWLFVDILATVMWLRAGNYCMAVQYAFWCINCIYGLRQWKRLSL
jgi:nicotinamide mononucleotide transporter